MQNRYTLTEAQLEAYLKPLYDDIAKLGVENESLTKQVAMDGQRFKEMEQHGLELKAENWKLQHLAQKHYRENLRLRKAVQTHLQWPSQQSHDRLLELLQESSDE